MSTGFEKFKNPKPTGAKKKEQFKQEKRAIKKEREEFFINQKREQRKAKKEAEARQQLLLQARAKPSRGGAGHVPATERNVVGKDPVTGKRNRIYAEKTEEVSKAGRKSYFKTKEDLITEKANKGAVESAKVATTRPSTIGAKSTFEAKKPIADTRKPITKPKVERIKKDYSLPSLNQPISVKNEKGYTEIPLNKYVAHSGVCGRREAADLIRVGKIKVNNKLVLEPGYKVQEKDTIKFNDIVITPQRNLTYILLNKPKDFLTTADDPSGRKTVMDLVANATPERVYPVGRLDRNTTGVLLLTNDGDLAQKLTHPSNEIKKIYEVKLDRPLTKTDAEKITAGLQLEDGLIIPDTVAYADANDKSVIGIEIHSGRNRIVRRIFEHLQYEVRGLDRVLFAGLTKKNVERGRFRFLSEKEIRNLKFLNASKGKKK